MSEPAADTAETRALLAKASAGDQDAFETLFQQLRQPLIRFINTRMDGKLQRRFDASDVIQETYIESLERFEDYLKRRPMPFALWVRKNAFERFLKLRRAHVNTKRRSVNRELASLDASTVSLANCFIAGTPSPSEQFSREEQSRRVANAILEMQDDDRDVLAMRHVDEMSHAEIAAILDIEEATARKRYGRALVKLQQVLAKLGIHGDSP